MSTPSVNNSTNGFSSIGAGLLGTPVANAVSTFIDVATGSLNSARAQEFQQLPEAEQRALLEGWSAQAATHSDPEVKRAALQMITGLVKGFNGSFDRGIGPRVEAGVQDIVKQLQSVPQGLLAEQPMPANVAAALERMRKNTSTNDDHFLLSHHASFLPIKDRGALLRKLDAQGASSNILMMLGATRSTAEYGALLQAYSGTTPGDGHQRLAVNVYRNARQAAEYEALAVRGNALGNPPTDLSGLINDAQAAFARARTLGGATQPSAGTPGAGGLPAGAPTDGSAPSDAGLFMTPQQAAARFEHVRAGAMADGELSLMDKFDIITASVDPERLIERMRAGDPALMEACKNNPMLMEMLKDRLAKINALRDGLTALNDDAINRRKKQAENLSRV